MGLKVIQVGCGEFGYTWLKDVVLQSTNVELIGLVDANEVSLNKANMIAGLDSSRLFTSIEDALKASETEAILNFTPPGVHKEIDFAGLNEGLPILSEKPIAENFEDVRQILEKINKEKGQLVIAENFRFTKVFREVKEIVSRGDLGAIDHVAVEFYRHHQMDNYHGDMDHPLLLDVSIHHFDVMRYILGCEAVDITARGWNPELSWYKGCTKVGAVIAMEGDIHVTYTGSLTEAGSSTDWLGRWRISGSEALLIIEGNTIEVHKAGDIRKRIVPDDIDNRQSVLEEFSRALKEDRLAETSIEDNIRTYSMVEAAVRSIARKTTVHIKEVEKDYES